MKIHFLGSKPLNGNYIKMGVMYNHQTDILNLSFDKFQRDLDLANCTPNLKVYNEFYFDKITSFEIEEKGGKINYIFKIPQSITSQKNIDMQMEFVENTTGRIWQTQIFNITFNDSININQLIEERYPNYLTELEKQLGEKGEIRQFKNTYEFPTFGKTNCLYILPNAIYRWDETDMKYYPVMSESIDIEIINGGEL